jgi:hypothetical protein
MKIISPYQGIVILSKNKLIIRTLNKEVSLNLIELRKIFPNVTTSLSLFIKNYQYIDRYTVLGFLNFFPTKPGKIYSVRKKESKYMISFIFITESDIWKINSDQVNNYSFFQEKKIILRSGNLLNQTSKVATSGIFLKKDGFKMLFQKASPIFLHQDTILKYKQGDFILPKKVIGTLVNYTQQTEDIVQGLPKIEELIEARKPKIKAYLAQRPGIFLNSTPLETYKDGKKIDTFLGFHRLLENNVIKCITTSTLVKPSLGKTKKKDIKKKKARQKRSIHIAHSIFVKDNLTIFNGKIFKASLIPSIFEPQFTKKGKGPSYYVFENKNPNQKILLNRKITNSILFNRKKSDCKWYSIPSSVVQKEIYKYTKNQLSSWLHLDDKKKLNVFQNDKGDYILFTKELGSVYLKYLHPILKYDLSDTAKVIFKPGNFIDIAEPITEGIIDIHELLQILFNYHNNLDGTMNGAARSIIKFQLLLVNSIQSIYQSQGVNISSKHIEIIVKQMTSTVLVKESGDTPLLPGELIRFSFMAEIYKGLLQGETNLPYKLPKFEPILRSATNAALSKDGFLSSAGFQETKRVLTKAAIEGSSDWLRGLKESIIVGRLIPAGSSFLNYKNYLDKIYLFKKQ